MCGLIDSDKSLCPMVPSHLFQFIFLYFSASHMHQRANGYKLERTEVEGLPDFIWFLSVVTLRLASPCHFLATVSDLLLRSRCIILSVRCDLTVLDTVLISILHFPALSRHIFRAFSDPIITLSEGLAQPLTCQPFLRPKPLK